VRNLVVGLYLELDGMIREEIRFEMRRVLQWTPVTLFRYSKGLGGPLCLAREGLWYQDIRGVSYSPTAIAQEMAVPQD